MAQAFARHNRELETLLELSKAESRRAERTLRFYRAVVWLLTVIGTIAVLQSCSL
jgi:hypothetical protein